MLFLRVRHYFRCLVLLSAVKYPSADPFICCRLWDQISGFSRGRDRLFRGGPPGAYITQRTARGLRTYGVSVTWEISSIIRTIVLGVISLQAWIFVSEFSCPQPVLLLECHHPRDIPVPRQLAHSRQPWETTTPGDGMEFGEKRT